MFLLSVAYVTAVSGHTGQVRVSGIRFAVWLNEARPTLVPKRKSLQGLSSAGTPAGMLEVAALSPAWRRSDSLRGALVNRYVVRRLPEGPGMFHDWSRGVVTYIRESQFAPGWSPWLPSSPCL